LVLGLIATDFAFSEIGVLVTVLSAQFTVTNAGAPKIVPTV
jgi:hypothetical protein